MRWYYRVDIYKCPSCSSPVAHGDIYCSKCGKQFTADDTKKMERTGTLDSAYVIATVIFAILFFIAIMIVI